MPAHLVAARREIVDRDNPEAREQAPRLDSERLAKILEAEDSRASAETAFKPVSDLDKFAPTLALFRVHVAQIASNRVLENGHQEFQLSFESVISPDQVGVLRGHQDSRVDCFFEPGSAVGCVEI